MALSSSSTPSSASSAVPATWTPPPPLLLSTPERPLILAFNLSRHELEALRSTGFGWQVVAVGDGKGELSEGSLLDVAAGSVAPVVVAAADAARRPPSSPPSSPPLLSVRATLLVLPEGCSANDGASEGLSSYPAAVDEALAEAGCALCVTGVGVEEKGRRKKKGEQQQLQLLSDALERLGRAHAAAYGIWTPLPRLESEEEVPVGATLATAAFLDAAPWDNDDDDDENDENGDDDESGESQQQQHLDLSGLAVVDGLLSPAEASDLLLYLTDGDPSCPVEGSKWQRGAVVDHDGEEEEDEGEDDGGGGEDEEKPSTSSSSAFPPSPPPPSSWGATPEFLDSLLSSPPPQLLALCSRLRALYSEQFSEVLLCPGNGEMSPGLTPLVLNAVAPEDAPALSPHVDADPLRSDPDGAWARAFGLYRNRSSSGGGSEGWGGSGGGHQRQTRPLLATALLYFQDWPLEDAAETLFFDAEEAGLGLAVRPRAGRVVVSEQDVVHRIVPPRGERRRRRKGGGKESPPPPPPPPRYSLVLKLALIPRVVEGEKKDPSPPAPATSVVLPAWRPGALRLGTAAGPRWPLPLA